MSECRDKQFERMLYAWETGLLDEDQQRQMELHILECDACFEKAQKFLDTARLLRYSQSVRREAARLAGNSEQQPDASPATRTPRRRWRSITPTLLVAAAVILLIILKPWQFDIRSTQEAVAAENRLAIVYFRNVADTTDAQRLGEIASNLLITDLSESNYLDVVSGQRLYDILKFLGLEGTKNVNSDIATRVAGVADARWLLTGNILQTAPHLVVTAQLSDAVSGKIIAAEHITGSPGEGIFSIVDRLTVGIKNDLSLPDAAGRETDPTVADVTTHSEVAYRYYLEGLDAYYKYYLDDARVALSKAVQADSTFAMAWYYLAKIVDSSARPEILSKLLKFSGNVGERQRRYIDVQLALSAGNADSAVSMLKNLTTRYPQDKEAHFQLGLIAFSKADYETCIEELLKATELDPLFKRAYNLLAYSYDRIGDFDHAIRAIDKYVDLAPDEANPYDSRAEIYAHNGRLDGAIESYQRALEIRPDYVSSLGYLGIMYVFDRQFERADSCFERFGRRADPEAARGAILYRAYTPVHRGRFNHALKYLDSNIAALSPDTLTAGKMRTLTYLLVEKAIILEALDDTQGALETMDEYVRVCSRATPSQIPTYGPYYVQLLVQNGELDRARQLVNTFKNRSAQQGSQTELYFEAAGALEEGLGNNELALEHYRKAADISNEFALHYRLARSYLRMGQLGEAVAEFKNQASVYTSPRAFLGVWSIDLHYYLGLAYEKSGWNSDAVREYSTFVDAWKDADTTIGMLNHATKRLEELKRGS